MDLEKGIILPFKVNIAFVHRNDKEGFKNFVELSIQEQYQFVLDNPEKFNNLDKEDFELIKDMLKFAKRKKPTVTKQKIKGFKQILIGYLNLIGTDEEKIKEFIKNFDNHFEDEKIIDLVEYVQDKVECNLSILEDCKVLLETIEEEVFKNGN